MEQRPLGNSGIDVSVIALGTWAHGATQETWGHVDDNESIATIQAAVDMGINLIDTAPIYGLGHSETIVGRALQGRREQVVLATKCGLLFPQGNELPRRCLARQSVLNECDASLRRLRTDVIDLYQIHWPDPDTPIAETMEALTGLLKLGKIRAIGVSNFSCEQIAAAREFGPVVSLQPPLSMIHRRTVEDLLPFCVENDMGVLAYSPLAKGMLTGKFNPESKLEGIRARDPDFLGDRFQRHLRTLEQLKPIAACYDRTIGQLAIQWCLAQPGVTAAIVGAKRVSQLQESAGGAGWTITDEDRARMDRTLSKDPS